MAEAGGVFGDDKVLAGSGGFVIEGFCCGIVLESFGVPGFAGFPVLSGFFGFLPAGFDRACFKRVFFADFAIGIFGVFVFGLFGFRANFAFGLDFFAGFPDFALFIAMR